MISQLTRRAIIGFTLRTCPVISVDAKHFKVEITARNKFWGDAVMVEWQYQFPDRESRLTPTAFTSSKRIG